MRKRRVDKEVNPEMQLISSGEMSLDQRKELIMQFASMLVDCWERNHNRTVVPLENEVKSS